MRHFWPKIDPDNGDGEYMQHLIIPHMFALKYIQCLMAKIVSQHRGLFTQIIFTLLGWKFSV